MKIYRLTEEGQRFVRVPQADREEMLDFLYEKKGKSATMDELLVVDGRARSKVPAFCKRGYLEGSDGF